MADITANVDAWSSTEASNAPSGATTIGTGLDDNLRAVQAGIVVHVERLARPDNLALACSVSSNALTIALKGKDGNDPSATNKVRVPFRNVTVATGDYTQVVVSAATSLVISSGSTLGTASNVAFRIWVVAFNDGGTLRLGAINCVSTSAGAGAGRDVTALYRLNGWGIASSTAEGGAGAADSAQTFYTGTAVTDKAYTVLGYLTYESGLGTAGTYASVPTRIQLFTTGGPLPGDIVQVQRTDTGAMATGTTVVPNDDTIPQSNEGDQYMSLAITPSSAANALEVSAAAQLATSAAGPNDLTASLFQDATANALRTTSHTNVAANYSFNVPLRALILAAGTSATTLKVRAGFQGVGTTTFNGVSGARKYGGVLNSFMEARELMG